MINTLARTKTGEELLDIPVERLFNSDIAWFWADFEAATQEEIQLLFNPFQFDPLSIEDCLEKLERPKVDYYDGYHFFVLHSLDQVTLQPNELDLFAGDNYVVTFHYDKLSEIENVRQALLKHPAPDDKGHLFITYQIFDKIVDQYFPLVYRIEDALNDIDIQSSDRSMHNLMDKVFEIRTDLLKLRRTINAMKELLYRILNSLHLETLRGRKHQFDDIYDHLLKLSDIIDSNREVTSDVRDNYLSTNSHKMNKIMTTLTLISSIFIPLTFIVGIYGMNFDYMPELRWRYGYFTILGMMIALGASMFFWFKNKGWME